ncbi:MAG TPA: DinB family protein [Thermomicrobiaceae bacterium]|nr:DinB family protein [Thermomicrobiaceae bacterium]
MTDQTLPLTTFYSGWGTYQKMFSEMLAPLTDKQLALPIGPGLHTVGEVAQHVIANRVWWFQVWMGEGDPELAPIAHWDPADDVEVSPRSAAELVDGLDRTWTMIWDSLGRWTADDLDRVFQPPASLKEEERGSFPPFSRRWIVWHVVEHEIHHGGELTLALGEHGLTGIYAGM